MYAFFYKNVKVKDWNFCFIERIEETVFPKQNSYSSPKFVYNVYDNTIVLLINKDKKVVFTFLHEYNIHEIIRKNNYIKFFRRSEFIKEKFPIWYELTPFCMPLKKPKGMLIILYRKQYRKPFKFSHVHSICHTYNIVLLFIQHDDINLSTNILRISKFYDHISNERTHWVCEIVAQIISGKAEYSERSKGEAQPLGELAELPSPRSLNSHLPFRMLPRKHFRLKAKTIHVIRNPKMLPYPFFIIHKKTLAVYEFQREYVCELNKSDPIVDNGILAMVLGLSMKRDGKR
ncbi:hypothetical protein KUTeg_023169 [Tegillarca granosa]|uniref:Sulfotransferase domain-containing protein n=1 Tax=Tegillarca granosa TaxID=220873 RepID=A0ABQ9E193_TEGGR|nr:hypothetical protein KUTeg_023169 [Tegillarca granosa]